MKLIIEDENISVPEVVVKGRLDSTEVQEILRKLKSLSTLKKLEVSNEDETVFIDVKKIVYAEVSDDAVIVHTDSGVYNLKMRLYELKEKLDNDVFAQISKSTLLNVSFVKSIQAEFSGNYIVFLKNSKEKLIISRRYFKEFKEKVL